MAVGVATTKSQVDSLLSQYTRGLRQTVTQIHTLNGDLQASTDADLTALGYTADDLALIRAITADLAQLYAIFTGAQALAAPQDFTAHIAKVWGVGP